MSVRGLARGVAAVALPAGAVALVVATLAGLGPAGRASSTPTRAAGAGSVPIDAAQVVCPGPETIGVLGAGAVGTAPAPAGVRAATAPVPVLTQALPAATAELGPARLQLLDGSSGALASAGPATGDLRAGASVAEARAVVAEAAGSAAPALVAGQLTVVAAGEQRTLTTAGCTAPADDQWLVGGAAGDGQRTRVLVANPNDVTVQVTLDVLADTGLLPRTPGSSLAVPARSRVVVLLDALAAGARAPVVHVRSTGGTVAAALSDTRVSGLVPNGGDDVTPGSLPATRVLVPAMAIAGPARVRVGVPGPTEAVARVQLLGPKGPVDLPDGGVLRVPAGGTAEADLGAQLTGTYTAVVTADEPVVAGGYVERVAPGAVSGAGTLDLAWSASSSLVTHLAGVPAAEPTSGVSTRLALGAPGPAAAAPVVVLAAGDGTLTRTAVRVPAGSTATVDVPAGSTAWVLPDDGSPGAAPGRVVVGRVVEAVVAGAALVAAAPAPDLPLTRHPSVLLPSDG
jgi:hypothetical protein